VKYLNQAISATNQRLTVSTSTEIRNAYVQYKHISSLYISSLSDTQHSKKNKDSTLST